MTDNRNNSGSYNSGHCNSGDCNSGHDNSGYYNSGHYNSGGGNSGSFNSGNSNSGNRNSGHYNSGNYNSGYYNSGHYNSGNYNSGYCNSGHFNTNAPDKVRLFNQWFDMKPEDIDLPYVHLPLTEWVDDKLVTRTYKEAWGIAWMNMSEDDKQRFLDLPGFDPDIFEEITGIRVIVPNTSKDCDGKVIDIDGKKYRLTAVDD